MFADVLVVEAEVGAVSHQPADGDPHVAERDAGRTCRTVRVSVPMSARGGGHWDGGHCDKGEFGCERRVATTARRRRGEPRHASVGACDRKDTQANCPKPGCCEAVVTVWWDLHRPDRSRIACDGGIGRQERNALDLRLRNQDAVERVFVQRRE